MVTPSKKRLLSKLSEYIESCLAAENRKHPFPNLAGFCSYVGMTVDDMAKLKRRTPSLYSQIMLGLEDAALNSGATASLVNMYLKQYGFWSEPASEDDFTCEHDMDADGI